MKTSLYKKIIPRALLTLAFSLVISFGAFVNTASANLVDTTLFSPNLLNALNLNGKIDPSALPQISDIPVMSGTNNSTGVHPDQVIIFVNNIINDPAVKSTTRDVLDKHTACMNAPSGSTDVCNGLGTTSGVLATLSSEINDLKDAVIALGDALTSARNSQDQPIEAQKAKNLVADAAAASAAATNQSSTVAETGFDAQGNTDTEAAVQQAPSSAPNAAAIKAAKDALAAGLKASEERPIALKNKCTSWTGIDIASCLADLTYAFIYIPASYALWGAGYMFDTILMLSIDNSNNMVAPDFVSEVWKIVRDFANMLFIFVLLYTGIMTMFGMADWAKTVRNVVIIALLINFSLFFSKVIIDAGNILALGVKSAISDNGSISAGIAGAFSPQSFLVTGANAVKADVSGGTAIIVFLVAAAVSGYAAYVFFKMALLFVGRLIGFWALMILSPFAFISFTLPKGNVFMTWLNELLGLSFVAPVFLFSIYIIMSVVNGVPGGLLSYFGDTASTNWFDQLMGPVIVAILLIVALQKALDFSSSMAGSFGKIGAEFAGKAMGMAGGVALGGAALAGRGILGGAAQRLNESGALAKLATSNSAIGRFAGRQAITLNDKARTGTWDARGTSFVQTAAKTAGIQDLGKPSEGGKGGYEGVQKRQDEADKTFAKKLKVTDEEKEIILGAEKSAKGTAETTKKTADSAVVKAQKAYDESNTAKEIKASEEGVKKTTDEAKKGQDTIAKAQKAYDDGFMGNGSNDAGDAALKQALDNAKTAGKPQIDALKAAEAKLEKAISDDKNDPIAQALKATIKTAEETATQAKDALETATNNLTAKEKIVADENARRRGSYADYVENRGEVYGKIIGGAGVAGAVVGGLAAGPLGAAAAYSAATMGGVSTTYSSKQAQATAKKIRTTTVKEEEDSEKTEKDASKIIKKLIKDNEDKNAPKPATATTPAH